MNTSEWPLKYFNLFALPVAIATATFSNSFWFYLLITSGIGVIIANVMAMLWIAKFKQQISRADPLSRLSVEIQGGNVPSMHVRFVLMQSLAGALIIAVWFSVISGVVYFVQWLRG